MHLYSYRGVSYTIAPSPLSPNLDSEDHTDVNPDPQQDSNPPIEKDILPELPPTPTPTAVIPMGYRGVIYLLERFHCPCPCSTKQK